LLRRRLFCQEALAQLLRVKAAHGADVGIVEAGIALDVRKHAAKGQSAFRRADFLHRFPCAGDERYADELELFQSQLHVRSLVLGAPDVATAADFLDDALAGNL
jgi:hypothetical protein